MIFQRYFVFGRNFFVADQCTKIHNKDSQTRCLDVFDKNLHALVPSRPQVMEITYDMNVVHQTMSLNIQLKYKQDKLGPVDNEPSTN